MKNIGSTSFARLISHFLLFSIWLQYRKMFSNEWERESNEGGWGVWKWYWKKKHQHWTTYLLTVAKKWSTEPTEKKDMSSYQSSECDECQECNRFFYSASIGTHQTSNRLVSGTEEHDIKKNITVSKNQPKLNASMVHTHKCVMCDVRCAPEFGIGS